MTTTKKPIKRKASILRADPRPMTDAEAEALRQDCKHLWGE